MNLDCMFHNVMGPYATVSAVLHVPLRTCKPIIVTDFKIFDMESMLVMIDQYLIMICYILHKFYEYSFNVWIFALSNVSRDD